MSRPASWAAATAAQAAMEARLTARRGENLLAMVAIPIGVLLVVGLAVTPDRIDRLVPAALSIALVASGMVNLGIATAYERGYGVLKRLGGSPLGRSGLVAAKMAVVLGIGLAQVSTLVLVAWVVLGWRPGPEASPAALIAITLLGGTTFAAIGLAIAGTLRAEAALVVANVLFLVAIALGGGLAVIAVPPASLAAIAAVLPVGASGDAFAAALGAGDLARPTLILIAWALGATAIAARVVRWD
jgi:ABC-2 type transport system permease protein